MFVVKIIKDGQILDVKHYSVFQNAVADIGNGNIFENIPDELFSTLGNPKILCFSESEETGISDDFEFRYENGVTVYVGEICTVDCK
jgi:hypothetical protein